MSELHLKSYVERMKRQCNVECNVGRPKVVYRESVPSASPFDYTRKKQSAGAGQDSKVIGKLETTSLVDLEDIDAILGDHVRFRNYSQTKVVVEAF